MAEREALFAAGVQQPGLHRLTQLLLHRLGVPAGNLVQQARLANPRFAADEEHLQNATQGNILALVERNAGASDFGRSGSQTRH